jgi:hypothetical protein
MPYSELMIACASAMRLAAVVADNFPLCCSEATSLINAPNCPRAAFLFPRFASGRYMESQVIGDSSCYTVEYPP